MFLVCNSEYSDEMHSVIKLVSCSTQLNIEFILLIKGLIAKKKSCFKNLIIMPLNAKTSTIVSVLTFMGIKNASSVELSMTH